MFVIATDNVAKKKIKQNLIDQLVFRKTFFNFVNNSSQQIPHAAELVTAEPTKVAEKEHSPTAPIKPPPSDFEISEVDFERVQTPFIIGIWILSASVAKIGKCEIVSLRLLNSMNYAVSYSFYLDRILTTFNSPNYGTITRTH